MVTEIEPETTPTTLTLEVSVMPSSAARLEMKVLRTLLLKKSLMFMAKRVVSWMLLLKETYTRQLRSSVTTKWVV